MLNMGLGFVFTARDLATNTIRSIERSFMRLDQKVGVGKARIEAGFQELGVGMAVLTAGAATLGGAFALASLAGRFEQAVAAVGAVAGASAAELDALRAAAIQAGIATQFSPEQATLGLRELAQAGFSVKESIDLLIPSLDLAGGSLGELTPQEAAGLAAQAMKAFGLSTDEAGISVDRMLQAVNVFALGAAELPRALGIASRGAQTLNQSLSETLIALGLVKNIVPGVERASTAVAVAMERMVKADTQSKLERLGVSVVDAEGKFRDFLDIFSDLAPALDKMTEAERGGFLEGTFGSEALAGINAILTQLTNGARTSSGELMKGADAVAYLRQQFETAGGTAARFREQMLDTFEGQKTLLGGSVKALGVLLGESFAAVFKPAVTAVVRSLNLVLDFLLALPAPVKRAFAGFVVAAGTFATFVGGILVAKASIALLVIAAKALGVTLGGLASLLAPVVLAVGAVALAVQGFMTALELNVGGVGNFFRHTREQASLAFEGLKQLFTDGGFSGAVRRELDRAENQGIKGFLIAIAVWGGRVQHFFESVSTGFRAGVSSLSPVLGELMASFTRLSAALGGLFGAADPNEAASMFGAFGDAGTRLGEGLAAAFGLIVRSVSAAVDIGAGLAKAWPMMASGGVVLGRAVGQLVDAFGDLFAALSGSVGGFRGAQSGWESLGQAIGFGVSVIITALGVVVGAASLMVRVTAAIARAIGGIISGIADALNGLGTLLMAFVHNSWAELWEGAKLVFFGFVDAVMSAFYGLIESIGSVVDVAAGLFGKNTGWADASVALRQSRRAMLASDLGTGSQSVKPVALSEPSPRFAAAGSGPMPAAAVVGATAPQPAPIMSIAPAPAPPISIQLQVDGQTLATAVHKAERDSASRSFTPLGSY
jgi:TP901 family phage tail tape measure protein